MKRFLMMMAAVLAVAPALAGADCGMSGAASCGAGAHGGCGATSLAIPALLVALGFGYWVLTVARKQDRTFRLIGFISGGVILAVSVLSLVCLAACGIKACHAKSAGAAMSCHAPADVPAPAK